MNRRALIALALSLAVGAVGMADAPAASGADYPSRYIRIVVPYAPGGGTDTIARILAQKLSDGWHQSVVVENRPGAAGIIGSEIVAKAAPDGYTLLVVAGAHAVNPSLYSQLPYDTVKDFADVAFLGTAPNILVVHPSVAARSVRDVVALAKSKPGQLTFGSGGVGQTPHLAGELFKHMAQVDITHVPYKGGAPAMADLIGGKISMMFGGMTLTLPYVKAGTLRAIATTGASRSSELPDLPTVGESGLPGYEANEWFGLFAPAATPADIVQTLNTEVRKILSQPDTRRQFATLGTEVVEMDVRAFSAFVSGQVAKWEKIVKDAGIHAE